MKILFGVQATGNGHITRARALSKELAKLGIEVDYLFSGRERSKFWDMETFGNWQCKRGLTFFHDAGKLNIPKTLANNSLIHFFRDVNELDLATYDLILTDFEPISARAAIRHRRLSIGIGHQYAFMHKAPKRGASFVPRTIMNNFAPASIGLGLHWHHFNSPILPPIAEVHQSSDKSDPGKIVVYLGFEDSDQVISLLEPFENYLFTFYGPFPQYESRGHIQLKPLSRESFQHDLASCGGVICNAGFELSSEAIQLGKKLLVKPLLGQMEQLSNGLALEQLGLGKAMDELDPDVIGEWLAHPEGSQVRYPNVAEAIARWIEQGDWLNDQARFEMIKALWESTDAGDLPSFASQRIPQI